MPVQIACPNPDCDASYSIAEANLGRVGRCKKCSTTFPLVSRSRAGMPPTPETDPDSSAALDAPDAIDLPSPFGRYRIVRVLGRGGMGAVYLAHDTQLDRPVALKVPHREVAKNAGVRERFLREARAAARFHHPGFCPIFDSGEVEGIPYLTMAYIEGGTLASKIERGEPWVEHQAAEVVRELAVALAELHRQGIIHRDLKPANVMVDARGGLILMDFGLARRFDVDDPTLTAAGAVLGTPAYMPPEQAEGNMKAVGPRSDLYTLGVILYELLTGHRPFEGPITKVLGMIAYVEPTPPSSLRPGLDPRLEAICLKAMAKKPEARHASMDELAGALAAFLIEEAAPSTEGRPPRPRPRFRSWMVIAAAAAFAALILGTILHAATDKGRIKIEVDDPGVGVFVDGRPVPIEGLRDPISLRAGEHALSLKQGDIEIEARKFVVRRGDNPTLKVDVALVTNALGMQLKLIPAGEFLMGSDETDPEAGADERVDGKKHKVRITKPFYLGTTEVTVGQFRRFVEGASYKTDAEKNGRGGFGWNEAGGRSERGTRYNWRSPGFPQTDDHPVVNVSWNDAAAFCRWLGRKEGQTYRLPTEAEWEYGCRAGQSTRYSSGDDPESLATSGNLADGTAREKYPNWTINIKAKDGFVFTAPVGRFLPNQFGLHDMHGNVYEWCADWYDSEYYARSPPADPLNSSEAESRVYRGGAWSNSPRNCRSAVHYAATPDFQNIILGFRVARSPSGPSK